MKSTKCFGFFMMLFVLTFCLNAITIKIGSIVPARSPWDKALRKLGAEWKKITRGNVRVKIYPGGIAGNEADVIRKMRIGILGGGIFTNRGLKKLYSDIYVLNIPFLITSEQELVYVLDKMKPVFEKGIEERGFKMIIWSMGGWIHIFSKEKVMYPDDLKRHKLSFTTGEPLMEQAWKKSGYHIVPNDLKDMMMALQSGMVNAFYLSPLVAASGQYFPFAPHMCSLKICPIVGGIVISSKIWNKIPAEYKTGMIAAAQKMAVELDKNRIKLEEDALNTMKENGLHYNIIPKQLLTQWKKTAEKGIGVLIDKVFSRDIYNRILKYIKEYRKLNDKTTDN